MSRLPRVPILVIALAILTGAALPGTARARRVGFANAVRDGAAGKSFIESLRPRVLAAIRGEPVLSDVARAALEDPLPPSQAPAELARAIQLTGQARDGLKKFEHEDALTDLRQAEVLLRGLLPTPEVGAALYEVHLLIGQVHAARKDDARALESFRLARRISPEQVALDPARYRPQVVGLYDQAGQPPGEVGGLRVTTEPPGATVYVDGRPQGSSPLDLGGLPAGDHYVAAAVDGHAVRGERVVVVAGQHTEQAFLLARLPGEERARALRLGLLRGGARDGDWERAAGALANIASADVLVVVRDSAAGGLEAASWDDRTGTISAWHDLADGGKALGLQLAAAERELLTVPTPRPGNRQPFTPDDRPRGQRGWYRTWWGTALLIGGGVLVTGALIALSADDGPRSLEVTPVPCWQDACEP